MRLKPALCLLAIGTSSLGAVVVAQDTDPVPTSAAGEEVFGAGYLPAAPTEEAVPLEAGRPAAGYQFGGDGAMLSLPSLNDTLKRLQTKAPGAVPPDTPLLRSVRKANKLRKSTARERAPGASPMSADEAGAELKVHFVDVGQGAGAILEFPCHTAIIDSGGEYASGPNTVDGGKLFADYLAKYFAERPERRNVIDLVITTHPHEDHLAGLRHIMARTGAGAYTVRNVVDNGQTHNKGSLEAQRAFRAWAVNRTPKASYSFVNFSSAVTATGVTNRVIDPITRCKGVDPRITIFWGAYNEKVKPGASEDWLNPNNHSLVVRVDFGDASFLFTGDLEDVGAKEMLREYDDNPDAFKVGVYHVSHHGAGNDTFDRFVKTMKPQYAILSMGTPAAQVRSTAWAYGHPRQKAIDVLQKPPEIVSATRSPQSFAVAPAVKSFKSVPITKAIYGTGWEGTIVMRARTDGTYAIVSGQ